MLIRSFLETISNDGSLDEPGSPQNLAATWLIEEDMAYLCPQDLNLIQRYALAVFYFSTEGDDWFECTAPTDFSSMEAIQEANDGCDLNITGNPLPVDAWLTPSSECNWGAVACNDEGFIETIDFGKSIYHVDVCFHCSSLLTAFVVFSFQRKMELEESCLPKLVGLCHSNSSF
jgi:hypothetical protein